jgi:hypothetical protein
MTRIIEFSDNPKPAKRRDTDNLFTLKRDRLLRMGATAHVDVVNPKFEPMARLIAENVPRDADSVYPLHIQVEQCAISGNEQPLADAGLADLAEEDAEGRHLRGYQLYAHRDTLRDRRPKINADEMRRLRGSIRAQVKDDPESFASMFDPAEVQARVFIPSEDGPARVRHRLPGCDVIILDNGSVDLVLLRRERYKLVYTVKAGGHEFQLQSKRRKPLPDPTWDGRGATLLETLARCAELWLMPTFVEPESDCDVFDIITLLATIELPLAA